MLWHGVKRRVELVPGGFLTCRCDAKTFDKTPKSAKKAGKEVAMETPKKMKTPKKPKTPMAEVTKTPVADAPKTPKTPKPKSEDAVQKTNFSQPEKSANGSEGGDGFFYKGGGRGGFRGGRGGAPGGFRGGRGGFRGGRGSFRGGRGSFRGGRGGDHGGRPGQVEDPAGVFMLFHEGVTADIAKALIEKYKGADFEFSRGITIHFKSEEEANKVKEKAADTEYGGVKPTKVGQAFKKREPEKRPSPEDEEAPKKKQKVEAQKVEEEGDEEEDSGEEEEGEEDDDEEGEEEEDEDDDDDDDDDDDEEDDDDDE